MTFSIAGRCADTGMVGVAITTSSIAVGSRCPWVRAGVGAVATQNVTLPSIGRMVLDRIGDGDAPDMAVSGVIAGLQNTEYRQVTAIDTKGRTAIFSGANTLGRHAEHLGEDCVAAGNLLASTDLPRVMAGAFASTRGHLAERLLTAFEAGLNDAGGEEGDVRSAALLVAHEQEWPLVDLRVDWDDGCPIAKLRSLWTAYETEMQDYVTRALNPAAAPSYGVPGDE